MKKKVLLASFLVVTFALGTTYLISSTNFAFLLYALPVAIAVLLLLFYRLDIFFMLTALLVPLSISIENFDMNVSLFVPTEPMLFAMLLLLFFRIFESRPFSTFFFKEPFFFLIFFYFAWMLITSITSQIPIVSLKFFLAHLWLVLPPLVVGFMFFYEKPAWQDKFIYLYAIPLAIVVIYTTINHAGWNFDKKAGEWVMQPFYKDHTIYGAATALAMPPLLLRIFSKKYSLVSRTLTALLFLIIFLGLLLSYSRGGWLGFFVAITVGIIVYFRIPFKYLFLMGLGAILLIIIFQQKVFDMLYKNKQDSSKNFVENIQSISNIRTDASNLERINRWSCAIRMAKDYPIFGTGPGTYQFLYGPYQLSYQKTIISTNTGKLGNAHSEYLGSLAEQGIMGMIIFITLVTYVFYSGFKLYSKLRIANPHKANLLLGILLALVSYFVHAFINNFLDTDKISFFIYSFIAIILAMKHQFEENRA